MNHRRHFIDRSLLYLLSTDIEFGLDFEQIGLVERGARFNLFCVANSTRVYNILGERQLGATSYAAVEGKLIWGEDTPLIGDDDVAVAHVRATLVTNDGATIDVVYDGILPTGLGTFRAIAGGVDPLGTPENPEEFRLVITPRYSTSHPRYNWLNELQCIGFGRVQEINGMFRRVTYDVYGLA
jgi:hypothetical protein